MPYKDPEKQKEYQRQWQRQRRAGRRIGAVSLCPPANPTGQPAPHEETIPPQRTNKPYVFWQDIGSHIHKVSVRSVP